MSANEAGAARFASGAAVVAGGSGGIGAAVCRALAAAGADVAFTYHRNRERAEAVAAEVKALGRRAEFAPVDLADETALRAFIERTIAGFRGIHTAVYAAGPYINMRHVSRLEPALFRETLQTDIFGCYNLVHAVLPALRETRGVLLAMATPAIRRYAVKDVLSAAPKAAIEALVKAVAAEEGRFGIRANCIGVGALEDGMYRELVARGDFDERFLQATKSTVALRRLGRAQEVADAAAFLVSDRASYITGQTLMVDGGYAM
ncbi:MAG TPA: SDR family oxidoreductase [Candidatus Cybelea sp.]|nr:SDR family oxidoreductase [Candidatus Cybelea sp.]